MDQPQVRCNFQTSRKNFHLPKRPWSWVPLDQSCRMRTAWMSYIPGGMQLVNSVGIRAFRQLPHNQVRIWRKKKASALFKELRLRAIYGAYQYAKRWIHTSYTQLLGLRKNKAAKSLLPPIRKLFFTNVSHLTFLLKEYKSTDQLVIFPVGNMNDANL